MANLKDIRKRIGSVKQHAEDHRAMKMVAASRLRKAQQAIETLRPYAATGCATSSAARGARRLRGPPAAGAARAQAVALLVMTSDRGLCGGFNANINRATERYLRENPRGHEEVTLDIVGRKGVEYFKRRETPISSYFREILTQVSLESASDIAEKAIVSFVEGELDALYVVYNEFKSAISQEVRIEQLLPVTPAESAEQGELAEFIYEPSGRARSC